MFFSITLSAQNPTGATKNYSYSQSQKGSSQDKWPMYLSLEGKKGNFRDIARLMCMTPLWQDDSSMLFGDIRLMMDNRQDREGNIALGYRHIVRDWDIASDGVILGAYAAFDRKKSTLGNKYNQGTFGVEALGDYFRFSANYYMLQNKAYHISRNYSLLRSDIGWSLGGKNLIVTHDSVINFC